MQITTSYAQPSLTPKIKKLNPQKTLSNNPLASKSGDRVALASSLRFAGLTMQNDRDARAALTPQLNEVETRIQRTENSRDNAGALGGILGGIIALPVGLFTSVAHLFLDKGKLTEVITKTGAGAGQWVSAESMQLLSEIRNGNFKDNKANRERLQNLNNELGGYLSEGQEHLNNLVSMDKKADTALQADGVFLDKEYHSLAHGLRTPRYEDIESKAKVVKPKVERIPGFKDLYEKITGKELEEEGIHLLQKDLKSGDPAKQILALQRYYPLEAGNFGGSTELYTQFVKNPNDQVAGTALVMMGEHAGLRSNPKQFQKLLLEVLNGDREPLIQAAFQAIHDSNPIDPRIDRTLNQLGYNQHVSDETRKMALALLGIRKASGLVAVSDSGIVAQSVMKGFIGNKAVENQLKALVGDYFHTLDNAQHTGPALKLFLPGKGGIGKSMLVSRLQASLFGNSEDLIVIHPKEIKNGTSLGKLLRSRANVDEHGKVNLDNRIILIDEFQAVDSIRPEEVRDKFLEDLKTLFPLNKTDVKASQKWLEDEQIEMQYPVLAIAMNGDFNKLNVIRKENEAALALQSRLFGTIMPSSPHRLDLNADLTPHIPDFINHFGQDRYFEDIENNSFDGPLYLSGAAKKHFLDKLNKVARYSGSIQGRNLSEVMVEDINRAIQHSESNNQTPFRRDTTPNGPGKIVDSLIIDVNKQNELVVRKGTLEAGSPHDLLQQEKENFFKKPIAEVESTISKLKSYQQDEDLDIPELIDQFEVGSDHTAMVSSSSRSVNQGLSSRRERKADHEPNFIPPEPPAIQVPSSTSSIWSLLSRQKPDHSKTPSIASDSSSEGSNQTHKASLKAAPLSPLNQDRWSAVRIGKQPARDEEEFSMPGSYVFNRKEREFIPEDPEFTALKKEMASQPPVTLESLTNYEQSDLPIPEVSPRPGSPTRSYAESMKHFAKLRSESATHSSRPGVSIPLSQRIADSWNKHSQDAASRYSTSSYHTSHTKLLDEASERSVSSHQSGVNTPKIQDIFSGSDVQQRSHAGSFMSTERFNKLRSRPSTQISEQQQTDTSTILTSGSKVFANASLKLDETPVKMTSTLYKMLSPLKLEGIELGETYPVRELFTKANLMKNVYANPQYISGDEAKRAALAQYPAVAAAYNELRDYLLQHTNSKAAQ